MVAAAAPLKSNPKPSVIAFEPRQIMLEKQTMKNQTEKKSGKGVNVNPGKNNLLLFQSIASYLHDKGFSKTLSAFQSEAPCEIDGWKAQSIGLEDVFGKYLETSEHPLEENVKNSKEQDSPKDVDAQDVMEPISKKKRKKTKGSEAEVDMETESNRPVDGNGLAKHANDSNENLSSNAADEIHVESKKKKSKGESKKFKCETDSCDLPGDGKSKEKKKHKMVFDLLGENIESVEHEKFQDAHAGDSKKFNADPDNSDLLGGQRGKSKEKKKKKHKPVSDSLDENIESVEPEKFQDAQTGNSKRFKSESDNGDSLGDQHGKSKEKKKKDKPVSYLLSENIEEVEPEKFQDVAKETSCENQLGETQKKCKDKKNKSKSTSNSCDGNTEGTKPGALEEAIKEVPLDNATAKSKDKKKKHKSFSTDSEFASNLDQTNSKKEDASVSELCVDDDEKRGLKKRKRLTSEEGDLQVSEEIASNGSKISKTDRLEENKEKEQISKENGFLVEDRHLSVGKKRKVETKDEGTDVSEKTSVDKKTSDSIDVKERPAGEHKEVNGHADGKLGKEEREGGPTPKTAKKERNGSAQPKTVNAFQRVTVDKVKFADERLQDNSYWAKDGADSGYGAKAQEVLGQVRGKDFRHEKTKKKRGSYRGGQIDLLSHSVKFNYSDDDEY